jgi:WD40 repeat protein
MPTTDRDLLEMASDGIQFLHAFSGVISAAAMHTYISALPLASPDALLFKNYITEFVPERPWVVSMNGQWSCARILRGHDNRVQSVAFSPDGSQIASGSLDETVRIWNAQTGHVIGEPFRGHDMVRSVAWSPTSPRIASCSGHTVVVWDTNTRERAALLEGHKHNVLCVAYSPDGSRLASGSVDCEIRIWNADTGELVGIPLVGHNRSVNCITFSPDGKQIASGSDDRTVRIWNAQTGQVIGEPLRGHTKTVWSVAWSPNGSLLASGSSDNTIRIWDIQTRRLISGLQGHSLIVTSVAFSPDGSRLASRSYDGTIRFWDPRSGKYLERIDKPFQGGFINSIAFSPDGQRIAGSDNKTVRVWARKIKILPSPKPSRLPITTTPLPIEGTILSYAERVDDDGWIRTSKGQRLLWVPFPMAKITVNSDSLMVEGQGDK